MKILFFFPWIAYPEVIRIGQAELLPYRPKEAPGTVAGITQGTIDAVLANYGEPTFNKNIGFKPIRAATIVTWQGDSEREEISDSEIQERLRFAELITFSALTKRAVASNFGYCNADTMTFVAQRFSLTDPGHIAVDSRRRDGFSTNFIGGSGLAPFFIRPVHVDPKAHPELDIALIEAIASIPDGSFLNRIFASILMFDRANTDGPGIIAGTEIVLLKSAFELLLDCGHRAKQLQTSLLQCISSKLCQRFQILGNLSPKWDVRWPSPSQQERPIEQWVHDFCHVRNSNAHRDNSKYSEPVWSISNHLLFGSWLFPLVLKVILENNGYGAMQAHDSEKLSECERFLGEDHFSRHPDIVWPWHKVETEINRHELDRSFRNLES